MVRANAVEAMDDDHAELLVRIAEQDADWTVRKLALDKVIDPGALLSLADRCDSQRVQRHAQRRASALLVDIVLDAKNDEDALAALEGLPDDASRAEVVRTIKRKAVRHAALDRIEDAEVLTDLARELTEQGLSLKAVARIDAGAPLLSIALDDPRLRVAQAALERIEDPDRLTTVAGQAKNKAIRNLARRKLKEAKVADPEHREESLQKRKRHAHMTHLCEAAERLSQSSDWVKAEAEIRQAQAQWAQLTSGEQGDNPQLDARFKTACAAFLARQRQSEQRRVALARQREALQSDRAARQSICERITALEGANALERLAALEQQWSALGPPTAPDKAESAGRFAAARQQCRQRHEAWTKQHQRTQEYERLLGEAQKAVAHRNLAQARRRLDAVRTQWTELTEAQGRDLAYKRKFAEVRRSLEQREKAAARETATREARGQQRNPRADRDQSRNLSEKRALCDQAEALAEAPDRGAEVAERVAALQAEWRRAGPISRSQSKKLGRRFHRACERALQKQT